MKKLLTILTNNEIDNKPKMSILINTLYFLNNIVYGIL